MNSRNSFFVTRRIVPCLALLLSVPSALMARPGSVRSIEASINRIEAELEPLPKLLLSPTPWTLGYRSHMAFDTDDTVTIELRFIAASKIDMIALFPASFSSTSGESSAFGFPIRFKIERMFQGHSGGIIVDYSNRDYEVTGIEPQLFPLAADVEADGIRITVLELPRNPTWWEAQFTTALSEIMVFSGNENVALNAKVDASVNDEFGYVWNHTCLTDGFSLFYPVDGRLRSPRDEFYIFSESLTLNFDLGAIKEADEMRIWPVARSIHHNFSQAYGTGFPTWIQLEQLNHPDDAKGRVIVAGEKSRLRPGSGPLMQRFKPAQGRYFRLTLKDPLPDFRISHPPQIALSEIELLAQGRVLTRGLDVTLASSGRIENRLTNGMTVEGTILPLREWIEGLSRRAQLTRSLEQLSKDLHVAQRLANERLVYVAGLSICIIIILSIIVWLNRLLAKQRWVAIRNRISCDLHDEIGANVSSLVQTTELIQETISRPTEIQSKLLHDAILTARQTSKETRNFIHFLESDKEGFDVYEQIRKISRRMLGSIEHQCSLEENVRFSRMTPPAQWDLLMFVKEALNNIIKHADATYVKICIHKYKKSVQLIITDNGKGIAEEHDPPKHLEVRAKKLKARLVIQSRQHEGTSLTLNFD